MPKILPFRGSLYNRSIVKDPKKVVAPPYDVISPGMQDELYRLSPYNIVRLILGKDHAGDDSKNNKYTRARSTLLAWMDKGVIATDQKPAFYVYEQDYYYQKRPHKRIGFFGGLKLEERNKEEVLKHEYTFSKSKQDRLKLIKATEANLCSIFSLFFDNGQALTRMLESRIRPKRPVIDISVEGVRHKLWLLADKKAVNMISRYFRNRKVFIADGHHRYEVAHAYRIYMRKKSKDAKNMPWDYVMMYFTSLDESGLTVMPTHRAVKTLKMDRKGVVKVLEPLFEVKKLKSKKELRAAMEGDTKKYTFGMYLGKEGAYLVRLRDDGILDGIIREKKSMTWKRLDVTILHKVIMERLLKLRGLKRDSIVYTRNSGEAVDLVDSKHAAVAFLLKATKVSDVTEIASIGDRMPHKSTYFYPKLLSGLVINKF